MPKGNKKKSLVKIALRQERFPHEYIVDFNGQKAAERSGYSPKTARAQASRLLTKGNIQAKIKELQEAANKKALLDGEETERRVDAIILCSIKDYVKKDGSFKEIHELTDEQASCVREISIVKTPIGTHRTLKFYDKIQAMNLKMKRLGMLKDGSDRLADTFERWLDHVNAEIPPKQ